MLIVAFAILIAAGVTVIALARAHEGYEDHTGFHHGRIKPAESPVEPVVAVAVSEPRKPIAAAVRKDLPVVEPIVASTGVFVD